MNRLTFKTKAQNLASLSARLTKAKVLPLAITSLESIRVKEARDKLFAKISTWNTRHIIVRSSSKQEDGFKESNAGAFLSIGHIPSDDKDKILETIAKVGESMPYENDEILIQPMLENIELCGVAFSVDKDNEAPYFCISYDCSGSNEAITSGSTQATSFYHYRQAPLPKDPKMAQCIEMIMELEEIFDCRRLDVEFAFAYDKRDGNLAGSKIDFKADSATKIDSNQIKSGKQDILTLYCLQVRPLVIDESQSVYDKLAPRALERLAKRIRTLNCPHPEVLGNKTIFGVMPDWNPAEVIGLKPKRLALSLYKEIITDNIWAYQRDNYGYRSLRSHPLMLSFLGIPYIDVRLSFNSFIPKNLDKNISAKLIDYYISRLREAPWAHDKIEFDIVFSCYDFMLPKKLQKLLDYGFNENEIKRIEFALLELTNRIISHDNGLYLKDLAKAKELESKYEIIINSYTSPYDKIYWLIEDCKRFGTLPFAGIARAAFVAMQMLDSLVKIGFLGTQEKIDFLASLHTKAKELAIDSKYLSAETKNAFLEKYGHLRAGSYNILSPRYDEAFEEYFGSLDSGIDRTLDSSLESSASTQADFMLSSERLRDLDRILKENGLKIDASNFFDFLKKTIEGREGVKFAFTKFLSKALSIIKELGENLEIAPEDMAHLDIKSILALYSSLYKNSPKERFMNEIQAHKEEFALTCALKLPDIIFGEEDIFSFYAPKIMPNFITNKSVMAQTIIINDGASPNINLEGKIILIPAADPGFDYLFAKNIAGFITCYGGANSHMAIRASELQIPAAIGVGEEKFRLFAKVQRIRLECETKQIFCL